MRKKSKFMTSLGQMMMMTATLFEWTVSMTNCSTMVENDLRENEDFERDNGSELTKWWDPIEPNTISMFFYNNRSVRPTCLVLPTLTNVIFNFHFLTIKPSIFLAITSFACSLLNLNLLKQNWFLSPKYQKIAHTLSNKIEA